MKLSKTDIDILVNRIGTAAALYAMDYNFAKLRGENLNNGLDYIIRKAIEECIAEEEN